MTYSSSSAVVSLRGKLRVGAVPWKYETRRRHSDPLLARPIQSKALLVETRAG